VTLSSQNDSRFAFRLSVQKVDDPIYKPRSFESSACGVSGAQGLTKTNSCYLPVSEGFGEPALIRLFGKGNADRRLNQLRPNSCRMLGEHGTGRRRKDPAPCRQRIFPDKGFYEGIVYSEGGVGGPAFSAAQHAGSLGPARLLAKRVDLAWARTLLDVGGGSGAYTLAFLKQNPKLQATILDFPETVSTSTRYALEAGMADRVRHVAGNAITAEWPANQDVVLMSYLWSAVGGSDIKILANRAYESLRPGGLVLVHDFMVNDQHEGPGFAAWYLLAALLDNPEAECLTPGFVETALRDAGFVVESTEPMLEEITQLTRARRV
jgi:2-hydroxy-4-(methylsulfanyl)butanoate S-methyltransferase